MFCINVKKMCVFRVVIVKIEMCVWVGGCKENV